MFCFGILRILEKNRKSAKTGKFGHYRAPMPLRREPTPRHRSTPRCQNGTPRVCRSVATVHSDKFFWIFVSEHLVFIHQKYRNTNK